MRIYRAVWRTVFGVVLILAVGWGTIVVGASALAYFVVGALLAGFVALLMEQDRAPDPSETTTSRNGVAAQARRVLRIAILAGVISVGVAGLLTALGTAGVLVALLAGATSPPVVGLARDQLAEHRAPHRRGPPPPAPPPTVGQPLDLGDRRSEDVELRRLWRQTFWALRESRCAQDTLGLAEARRACLREMERRHPEAFTTWLRSGPKAWTFPTVPGPDATDG